MKIPLICCLALACLVLAEVEEPFRRKFLYGQLEVGFRDMKGQVDVWINTVINEERESGMDESLEAILDGIMQSVCFDQSSYSDTCANDMFFGCGCMDAFSEQDGDCSQVPCRIAEYVRLNLVDTLRAFRDNIDSIEDLAEFIVSKFNTPFMEMSCPCFPGFTDAAFQCIRQYDAKVIQPHKELYQYLVLLIDWDTLQNVADTVMTAYCAEVGGERCFVEFGNVMTSFARMLDNSLDEDHEDRCSSLERVEAGFLRYVLLSLTTKSRSNIMKGAKNLLKKTMCDPECQEYMADTFYSCCAKNGLQVVEETDFGENYRIMMENTKFMVDILMGGGGDDDMSELAQIIFQEALLEFKPEEECRMMMGKENFYTKIGETCDLNA